MPDKDSSAWPPMGKAVKPTKTASMEMFVKRVKLMTEFKNTAWNNPNAVTKPVK
jgi:hypothetical protein